MTNKIEVEQELLERMLMMMGTTYGRRQIREEVRALLDAPLQPFRPAPEVCTHGEPDDDAACMDCVKAWGQWPFKAPDVEHPKPIGWIQGVSERFTGKNCYDRENGYIHPVYASPFAPITAAAADVFAERKRQVSAKGWTPGHDDEHACDEIAAFACFYAMPPAAREWDGTSSGYGLTFGEAMTPADWQPKIGNRRRELVKAGALILAEIERIDRKEAKESSQ